jgi:hypothetical protein
MLLCVVNVPLQPVRAPRAPHPERVLRSFTQSAFCEGPLACPVCRGKNQPRGWPLHRPELAKTVLARHSSLATSHFAPLFSKAFLLTSLRTLAPASPFFSHTSQKHPGVVWTPSNSCPLCNLRTPHLASCAPAPYRWAIALCCPRCHNRFSGWLTVRCVALGRCRSPGQETFRRSSVSNTLSGRGLGKLLPIRSAKRPDAGKWYLGRPLWPRPAWASSPSRAGCLRTG